MKAKIINDNLMAQKEGYTGLIRAQVHSNLCHTIKSEMAYNLIKYWATVAATPDGEDSSGRQKLRLQTPEELVAKSFDVTEKFFAEATRRNWIHNFPGYIELDAALSAEDEAE
jgi:hypothetical protein